MVDEYAEIQSKFTREELEVLRFKGEPLKETLTRYLQARKFDIHKVEQFMRRAIEWRNTIASACVEDGKEQCLGCPVEEILQFYPGAYLESVDKYGRPIWYEQTGQIDIAAVKSLTTVEKYLRYHICLMEELQDRLYQSSKKLHTIVNKTVSILDLKGLTITKLSQEIISIVKQISVINSDYYPETMGAMFIINTPFFFMMTWTIIKGFLDPRTVSKIHVLGGQTEFKPMLLEIIDEESLPAELEGLAEPLFTAKQPFQLVSIASSQEVTVELILYPHDKAMYKFFTTNNTGIVFAAFFKADKEKEAETLSPEKEYTNYECSNGRSVAGEYEATTRGTFIVTWKHTGWVNRHLVYSARRI